MRERVSSGKAGERQAAAVEHITAPRLVNTRAAAAMLGKSPATLKRWRYEGIGPDYVAMEGSISYDVAVLEEYIRKNTRVPSVRAQKEGIHDGR